MISEPEVFIFADFVFDAREKTLRRASGETVSLPPRTSDLLAFLIENAGRLVSKDELLETVWAGAFVEESNLTHHVAALRKVLGEGEDGRKFVETVPRRGYRFVAPVVPREQFEVVVTERTRVVEEEIEALESPLIGRGREISIIKNLLRRADTQILTLTGVGGAGKTSLARAVAQEMKAEFSGGVNFVDLSSITDSSLVLSTVAQSLKINTAAGENVVEAVKDHLRAREMLLILDNFEQVSAAAPTLLQIVSSAGKSKILITSRTRLRLQIEREHRVPPLAVPSGEKLPEEIIECAAARLFVERAARTKPGFALTDGNAPAVAEICRRLEGLPLAVELAAARVRLLSPHAILERLANQLGLLTGGARDLPARQQTIRAAIAWSYDLLDADEKRVFEALAVFAGGFTVEAAESLFSEGDLPALDALESLLDKNLLQLQENETNETRLRFLEVVREFARERLAASGNLESIRQAHADYYLALAEKREADRLEDKKGWHEDLKTEHDNVRAALGFLTDAAPEKALRLALAMGVFWSNFNHFREGRFWLEERLRRTDAASRSRGLAFRVAAMLAWKQGDYRAARALYEESLRIGEELNDRLLIAVALNGLGTVAYLENDNQTAKKHFAEALPLSRAVGDERLTNSILIGLGEIARVEEDFAAVRRYNEEVAAYARRVGDDNVLCGSLINLGAAAFLENDSRAARRFYDEASALGERVAKQFAALCYDGFAALAVRDGDAERARYFAREAEALLSEIGYALETPDRLFREKYLAELERQVAGNALSDSTLSEPA